MSVLQVNKFYHKGGADNYCLMLTEGLWALGYEGVSQSKRF